MDPRRGRAIGVAALVAAAGAPALSCGVSDEVVAERTLPEGGVPEGGSHAPCDPRSPQCPDGEFCSADSCDAISGTCLTKPLTCDTTLSLPPTCGCPSGLGYLNDCFRKQHGDSSSTTNLTTCKAILCTTAAEGSCPTGAYCALYYYQGCATPPEPRARNGLCVILPSDPCPGTGTGFPLNFVSCGTTSGCMDYCTAIRQRAPFSLATQTCM